MQTIKMFKYSRTSTLILLTRIDEAFWDIQPNNFPNTIRWLAGHIYAEAEGFSYDADHDYEIVRPDWQDLFIDGTRPSEWPELVPTKDEIVQALVEQETRIETFFKNKAGNRVSNVRNLNGLMLETIDASLQFITWHEGIHIGDIKSLRSIVT